MKQESKQAKSMRKRSIAGICPRCGTNPRALDQRYMRDIKIRAAIAMKKPFRQIAKEFDLAIGTISRIAKRKAGVPKLLSACESCLGKVAERQQHYRSGATVSPAPAA